VPYINSIISREMRRGGTASITRRISPADSTVGTRLTRRDSVLQYTFIEEHQRVERLVLAGRGQPATDHQIIEESFDVGGL
jgi:hypothetical protein